MAITKISELPEISTLTAGDYFIVNDENAVTNSINYANLGLNIQALLSVTDLTFNGELTIAGGVSFTAAADLDGPVNVNGALTFTETSSISGITVSDVDDIDLTTPATANQVLAFDSGSSNWVPRSTDALPERTGDLHYDYDNSTVPNPLAGHIRFNATNLGDATVLYISSTDSYGQDLDTLIPRLFTIDQRLFVQQKNDASNFVVLSINAIGTDLDGYWSIPVSVIDSGAFPADEEPIVMQFITNGLVKAPLASPTLTGVPAAPTAVDGTNTTQIATTAFVTTAVSNIAPGVDTVNGRLGDVTLTATDVGLENCNNTADIDKPISLSTQDALDLKADETELDTKLDIPSYTVTANGTSDYIFNGPGFDGTDFDPDIYLVRGKDYKFVNQMGEHPFQIQTEPGLGGATYGEGITNNGVSNGTLDWEVQMDCPDELYYQCTTHADMGGRIFVMSNKTSQILDLNVPTSASDTGTIGEIRFGTSYLYICTAANTWKRVAIDTWT
ncbi:baseplate wedge tail fiber connector [Synechococcus phage S-N03]|uniref:Baseplate wedge tail fiber connector n=1 Tax=Synechococcus phage S-N03 TaxID=2718943 RepID=A0A6G8R667_9CAUD|nr:minor tail protein [Synechococcus phage S-N03]QIN96871.1 baseplate wedge tail fiber connector [Synechococcus phage S-N03]